jgi:hypothetical protein
MFAFICLLWSLWNAASLEEWLTMLSMARHVSATDVAWIAGGLLVLGIAAVTMGASTSERTDAPVKVDEAVARRTFWLSAAQSGALALALVLADRNAMWISPTPEVADVLARLSSNQLNEQDMARLERGYYESLLDEQRFNPELGELYMASPANWNQAALNRNRNDGKFPRSEYIPNHRIKQGSGASWTTNRFGMRDQDYERAKPPGTYRIAVVGDSNAAGLRVGDEEVFEHLVEKRLNEDAAAADPPPWQILNFSVSSYGLYARLKILPKVFEFDPDALLCVSVNDWHWVVRDVGTCVTDKLEIPDAFIRDVLKRAGLEPGMSGRVCEHRLQPYRQELARWCFEQMAQECRQRGVRPLAAFLPRQEDPNWLVEQLPALKRAAEDAGFTVLDLTTAYDGVGNSRELWVSRWDAHPSARGHQLLADLLYKKLEALNLRSTEPSRGSPDGN